MKTIDKDTKIVVMGGGTGSFSVLSGLKNYASDITALVSMADDGGSTGQLRDELGVLPPGDVRQCLVALSHSPRVRDLFTFRFDEGGLKGHSFGNLFLAALEKTTGDFRKGIELASEVLRISGRVEPITLDKMTLVMQDGVEVLKGEHDIDGKKFDGQRPEIWLEPEPKVNSKAIEAIEDADLVVIAPGGLYTSLGAVLVVPGVGEALRRSKAKKLYICNLVNKPGQTDGFKIHDYADELERLAGTKFLDYALYNTRKPSANMLEHYAADGELPVEVDRAALKNAHYTAVGANLLAREIWKNDSSSDPMASDRTLIRHDSDKLARELLKIYFS